MPAHASVTPVSSLNHFIIGMGLLKGNQTQLGFLYPKTTDFIFSVIGEEMGFLVAGAVIVLYVILITCVRTVLR